MPVFGKETIGALATGLSPDLKFVTKYTLSENGDVSKLTLSCNQSADPGNVYVKGVIYDDDGVAGDPGTLLGTTSEVEILNNPAYEWNDLQFASPVSLLSGNYWLGLISGTTGSRFVAIRYDSVADASRENGDTYSDGPSDPFGASGTNVFEISINATYIASSQDVLSMQAHVFGHNMW